MNGMKVNNGIIIDGVLHEAVQDNIHCASCSLYEKCAEVNYTACITDLLAVAVLSIVAK